jgi:condensin complex subunit 3
MLSQDILPEGLVARCLDVLRKLSPNERDLIRVVVEVIHTLRDPEEELVVCGSKLLFVIKLKTQFQSQQNISTGDDTDSVDIPDTPATVRNIRAPKPAEEMSPEERARVDAMDLRCLSLCIGMLERVNGVRRLPLVFISTLSPITFR